MKLQTLAALLLLSTVASAQNVSIVNAKAWTLTARYADRPMRPSSSVTARSTRWLRRRRRPACQSSMRAEKS